MNIPRCEHPRPGFVRANWQSLNGQWQFEIDNGRSGVARGLHQTGTPLSGTILVPFCPESALSGVEHRDFISRVWYKRTVELAEPTGRVLLHFGAVDYHCKVFVNGTQVGEHKGGYVSFSFDITHAVHAGENEIALFADDDSRDRLIPSGKQSARYHSWGCYYTRTTGIWQSVWLEFLPRTHLSHVKYFPNITDGSVTIEAALCGSGDFCCEASFEGRPMGRYAVKNAAGLLTFTLPLAQTHLWDVGQGNLYDVCFSFGEDRVSSYFGLRQVRMDGYRVLLNGRPVFQRLVLDQGFYPDGIYTAPTDADLVRDIELSLAMGFNGARLHEKVFEARFLYHADRLGYLVWGEYPDWGLDHTCADHIYAMLPEWMEELRRDFNHPSIVGWCPHNETWDKEGRKQFDPAIAMVYDVTKALDPTRPCIDTSGSFHVKTDIFDVHDYDQNPVTFKEHYDLLMTQETLYSTFDPPESLKGRYVGRQTFTGNMPVFVSEYGGIRWAPGKKSEDRTGSWGYGADVCDEDEFMFRFRGLTDALLDNDHMFGLCYTQLTDVEQEQNGLYTYDRRPKFDPAVIRSVLSRKAAIEKKD
ncbi:MAG: beta-galactosidase [Oscillospiraceae bacterium]|nr:beta-galactosidase [Oscillospiraceae bacterium]